MSAVSDLFSAYAQTADLDVLGSKVSRSVKHLASPTAIWKRRPRSDALDEIAAATSISRSDIDAAFDRDGVP